MNKLVDQYLLKHKEWQLELTFLRDVLCSLSLKEEVKWGIPVYTINGKNVVGLGAFKSYVGLWFYQGALLADNEKVLVNAQEGKTRAMRQWRFTSVKELNKNLISKYVNEAIANQKQGREIKPAKAKAAAIPNELLTALKLDKRLKKAFESFPPYKQKEYAEYITEAKRLSTKAARLEKIKPMILAAIGLNDKYR